MRNRKVPHFFMLSGQNDGAGKKLQAEDFAVGLVLYKKNIIGWKFCKTIYFFVETDGSDHTDGE